MRPTSISESLEFDFGAARQSWEFLNEKASAPIGPEALGISQVKRASISAQIRVSFMVSVEGLKF